MPPTRFAFLFRKYYQKTASPEEVAEFTRLAGMDEHAAELQQLLEEAWAAPDDLTAVFTEAESEKILAGVLGTGRDSREGKVVFGWRRIAVAASVLGLLGLGIWWWALPPRTRVEPTVSVSLRKPVTGGNKAILILGNGSAVTLDSTKNGLLATQGSTNIVKLASGQLAYQGGSQGVAVLYNTVRTPRGGQYQVTLPDGSKVWLNAATSLRFPTAFTGGDRTVELNGEAYFEIAPEKGQPFKVKVGGMEVDVLGTHFNVMAYDDEESFRTTLLSGAVRVEGGNAARILKPGEEARWDPGPAAFSVEAVDTDQCVAWKNGLFQFDGAPLKELMRQVARWYDIDVHYEGTIDRHFSGYIARSAPLADVLHLLERAGKTSFTLEGRTVTIKPK